VSSVRGATQSLCGQQRDGRLARGVIAVLQCAGRIFVDGGVRGVDVSRCLLQEAAVEIAGRLRAIKVAGGEEALNVSPSSLPCGHRWPGSSSLVRSVTWGAT
jgi:hypothetical protein